MKTQLIVTAALFALMPLAGCGTLTGGSRRSVHLTSEPAGAQVTIADASDKTVFTDVTPCTAKLCPGAGYFRAAKYTVTFTKPGCRTVTQEIKHGINGWYIAGNFFFGGLIGWLVIDPLTGAMWTLDSNCSAVLPSQSPASASDGKDLKIIARDAVPPNLQSRLRRVK